MLVLIATADMATFKPSAPIAIRSPVPPRVVHESEGIDAFSSDSSSPLPSPSPSSSVTHAQLRIMRADDKAERDKIDRRLTAREVEDDKWKAEVNRNLVQINQTFPKIAREFSRISEAFCQVDDRFQQLLNQNNQLIVQMNERFAQVDERFSQVDERFAQVDERFAQVDERFAQVDERFAQVDQRLSQMDQRFARVDQQLVQMDAKFEAFNWNRAARLPRDSIRPSQATICSTGAPFPKTLGRFWELRKSSTRIHLVAWCQAYSITDYQSWSTDEDDTDTSSDESFADLADAVEAYPLRALEALAKSIGVKFEKIRPVLEHDAREQRKASDKHKRSRDIGRESPASAEPSRPEKTRRTAREDGATRTQSRRAIHSVLEQHARFVMGDEYPSASSSGHPSPLRTASVPLSP